MFFVLYDLYRAIIIVYSLDAGVRSVRLDQFGQAL